MSVKPISELDWERIYEEGHPDPVEDGWPEEAKERRYHPPTGHGAQRAAGWNEDGDLTAGVEGLVREYQRPYPDWQRRAWIERRVRSWWDRR